jgi:hypothetical protein
MAWIIFFCFSVITIFLLIPFEELPLLCPAGIIGLILCYIIDNTLVSLGAFSYKYPNALLSRIPLFYWLSSFFGGVLLFRFYPLQQSMQFGYIVLASALFLVLELIMYKIHYFFYHNWNLVKSLALNIFGFTITIRFAEWVMYLIQS